MPFLRAESGERDDRGGFVCPRTATSTPRSFSSAFVGQSRREAGRGICLTVEVAGAPMWPPPPAKNERTSEWERDRTFLTRASESAPTPPPPADNRNEEASGTFYTSFARATRTRIPLRLAHGGRFRQAAGPAATSNFEHHSRRVVHRPPLL